MKELVKEKTTLENKLKKISELKNELNNKINKRLNGKRPDKVEKDKALINETDKDSSLMKMKNNSRSNAYLQVNSIDSKADIIVGSVLEGFYDESHNAVKLFKKSNNNCNNIGKYHTVCFDSAFNTMGTCVGFKSLDVDIIAPTKEHENITRNPDKHKNKINYDEKNHEVICSENVVLHETSKSFDGRRGTIFYIFTNKESCKKCKRVKECVSNKEGYRKIKIDSRSPIQKQVLERYKSKEGQKIYKNRSHVAETYQGDLIHNGKFDKFLRRGIEKVRVESKLNDIIWNLRRIFNSTSCDIIWEK
jgi:DDE family transposase